MGAVYRAEQLEPVRRTVAFKVIRSGIRGDEILRRFDRERQSLARLDHDCIARFLDAGTTDVGTPYFVMDFVVGESLVRACDGYRLDVPARVRLFKRICDGVHHAHQRGLIHRDLKPANILVSGTATTLTPKIIDFGIARAMEHEADSARSALTLEGSFLGTPAYMSPEQLAGSADLDVRTDVYALGVILHELLTGELPFEVVGADKGGLREFQERVRLIEPRKPSERVSTRTHVDPSHAATRSTTANALARTLRGDLDWIILKSLAKERDLRYSSALDLSQDIERHLQDEPVIAGPPTTWYRVRKFIVRHGTMVFAAALVVVILIAATIISVNASIESKRSESAAVAATAREQRSSYLAKIAAAAYALERGNRDDAQLRLDACFEPLRGFEWRHLRARILENDIAIPFSHRFDAMVMAVALLPGTTRALAGSNDGTLRCFDTLTGEEFWRTEAAASPPAAQMPFDGVLALAASPDAATFVSGHFSGRVVLRDANTGLERHTVECGARVFATAYSADGREFLAAPGGIDARGRADLVRHRVDDGSLVASLDRRDPRVFAILCADTLRIEGTPSGVRVFDGERLATETPTDHYVSRLTSRVRSRQQTRPCFRRRNEARVPDRPRIERRRHAVAGGRDSDHRSRLRSGTGSGFDR
jgi:serine/threonine protein kinase